jgi:hypothetical protein
MLLLQALPLAMANGQTVHVWISHEALEQLPDGELKGFLSREDLEPMLIHGTMFPDGGYPLNHPYAEMAHWEPFQSHYLDWIKANYEPPWTDEAAQHIAFLMGMASHGMADQTHDAWLFDWSRSYDAEYGWAQGLSLDESNDFVWAHDVYPSEVPTRWLPDTFFVQLYADLGVEVDTETLNKGQGLLEAAIALVAGGSQSETLVEEYRSRFPWGTAAMQNLEVPGNPEFEAERVASYWQDLWARLHDTAGPQNLRGSWPSAGGYKPVTDHTALEARVSLVFARGLITDETPAEQFSIVDSTGKSYPFSVQVYYGNDSHVVHLIPSEDWALDEDFTITVFAGLPGRDGTELAEDIQVHFTTTPPVPEQEISTQPGKCEGCTSAQPMLGWVWLGFMGWLRQRRL